MENTKDTHPRPSLRDLYRSQAPSGSTEDTIDSRPHPSLRALNHNQTLSYDTEDVTDSNLSPFLKALLRNQALNQEFLSVFKDFREADLFVLGMDNDWKFDGVEPQTMSAISGIQIDLPHYLLPNYFFREFIRHKDRRSLRFETLVFKTPIVPVPEGTRTRIPELADFIKYVVTCCGAVNKVFAKMTYHLTSQDRYNDRFVRWMDEVLESKGKLWRVSTSREPVWCWHVKLREV